MSFRQLPSQPRDSAGHQQCLRRRAEFVLHVWVVYLQRELLALVGMLRRMIGAWVMRSTLVGREFQRATYKPGPQRRLGPQMKLSGRHLDQLAFVARDTLQGDSPESMNGVEVISH